MAEIVIILDRVFSAHSRKLDSADNSPMFAMHVEFNIVDLPLKGHPYHDLYLEGRERSDLAAT